MNTKPLKNSQRCRCIKCNRKRRGYDEKVKGTSVKRVIDNTIPKGVARFD